MALVTIQISAVEQKLTVDLRLTLSNLGGKDKCKVKNKEKGENQSNVDGF